MGPLETLQLWFARFAEEPSSARDLWSQNATVHTVDGGFTGDFDHLLSWYAGKTDREGAGFLLAP